MKIGTYYYPEQWPREQWQRDINNIVAMGMQIVHMAEFAWHSLEPKPGQFEFAWLEECVEMCRKKNLDVILCTPTAAPPTWLLHGEPSTMIVDKNGTRDRIGGRRKYNPQSSKFREATTRIVTAMAERWGQHPSIIGWQIDNEYSDPHDQSEESHAAFRAWLQRRYGTIENLNKAWGNQFWNTYYDNFDQILFPAENDHMYRSPHHALDGQRFWSWAFADFNKLQADILKSRIGDRFITHNFMNFHKDTNPADFADDLNLMSWDSYPVTGWGKQTDENYRLGYPDSICLTHDWMASFNGRWAQMELQPGQTNWSGTPVLVYPGAVRLWIWTAFAHGAEFVTTYRFRQPLWGVELFHHGLIGTDGVTPSQGGREFSQCVSEIKKLDLKKVPAVKDDFDPAFTVGLYIDFEQLWYYTTLPQAKRWDQVKFLRHWYEACSRLGLRVKVLNPGQPWPSDLAMVIAPGVQMIDDATVRQFSDYANGGGRLVLTCRTGLMDRNGQLLEGPTAKPILPLIGGLIEAYDGLPEETFGQIEMDGKKYPWNVWGDLLYAEPSTRVLAKYADQFYAGAVAAMQKKVGTGSVTYCGVFSEYGFISALVEKLSGEAKLKTTTLPTRVHVVKRGPYRILLNYQDKACDAPAARGAKFLIGARRVEPAGVAVWEETQIMAEGFFDIFAKVNAKPEAAAPKNAGDALSVSQLTRQIDGVLKAGFPSTVTVKGEVSNFSAHRASGHFYFTLKDSQACIDCVMWKSDALNIKFTPTDGMELLVRGRVAVYAMRGKYQLYVTSMHPVGQGALELAFQQLQRKLEAEGLFAAERKRSLPIYPTRIALVTGRTTAALHDILKVFARFPWLKLFLYDVPVQGEGGAEKIAAAVGHLNRAGKSVGGVDVILLTRGGGSLEDLWQFNVETVARAIAASKIPVITGIGHEVDVSIADLVADYHAHTPTEAAQVLTAHWRQAKSLLQTSNNRLTREIRSILQHSRQRLREIERHETFRRPLDRVNAMRQLLDDRQRALSLAARDRLGREHRRLANFSTKLAARHPQHRLTLSRERLRSLAGRLSRAIRQDQSRRASQLQSLAAQLLAVAPEQVLRRGYSITTLKKGGAIVRSATQVKGGETLVTRVQDGQIESIANDPNQPRLF